MGAPAGHVFFGNQYTSGDYVKGSFTYEGAKGDVARSITKSIISRGKSNDGERVAFLRETLSMQRVPSLSISTLIAAGTVALIGGVATYAYLRSRSASPVQAEFDSEEIASFGLCESCGLALATTGPAELRQDELGDFVVCENCSRENRAKYSQEAE